MPLLFETDAERATLTEAWGDTAYTDTGLSICGQYNEPSAEALLMEARAPEFFASLTAFEAASAGVGTTLASVNTFSGRSYGPFKIISWERSEDGNFITAGLQST